MYWRRLGCPSIRQESSCPHFVSEAEFGNPWMDLQFWTNTSLSGCRCAFLIFLNFTYSNGRPSTIIGFNMPDLWPHFVSGEDLDNPCVDLFHIAHTHPLGGVDVPFVVFEI